MIRSMSKNRLLALRMSGRHFRHDSLRLCRQSSVLDLQQIHQNLGFVMAFQNLQYELMGAVDDSLRRRHGDFVDRESFDPHRPNRAGEAIIHGTCLSAA